MYHGRFAIVGLLTLLGGCAARGFNLSDESAMDRLMSTKHVAKLQRNSPTPLTCRVEDVEPDARLLYLGESHADHTVRVGTYRVTSDGRVWLNADSTLLEDRWVIVE
jgi:hypothetical protein